MSPDVGFSRSPLPWYRQFWPWFLIALPLAAVLAGFATLYLALREPDSLVTDDWYREGKAINRTLARDERARALGVHASMEVNLPSLRVVVELRGKELDEIEGLHLELAHPTLAARDQVILLKRQGSPGVFSGRAAADLTGRWVAILTPVEQRSEGSWRLMRRVAFPSAAAISFEPRGH